MSPQHTIHAVSLLCVAAALSIPAAQASGSAIPALDELAGEWQDASSLRSLPALNNTHGAAQVERDVLSIGNASFPPVTFSGGTGRLLIDGQPAVLEQTRWYPYQVLRRGTADDLGVETAVRMPFNENGFLFHVLLTNTVAYAKHIEVKVNLAAGLSSHDHWGWDIPRKPANGPVSATLSDDGRSLILRPATGNLAGCFSFEHQPDRLLPRDQDGSGIWAVTLPPHASLVLNYTFAEGTNVMNVHAAAAKWAAHFDSTFARVQRDWQARFDAMFQPGNGFFSGSLPTLVTTDQSLRRVYYESLVSLLSVCRTSYPVAPRVYVSNAPEYNGIMVYFWDTREWATVFALLDPDMLKTYLRGWLAKDIHRGYAEEFLTGTLQGPWYSANDFSVFVQLDTYLNVTGDRAFLAEKINGKTVLEHMEEIATCWKTLVRPGRTLADYGEADNLLECVPTYIHEVPSFNAANVWMMRRLAAIEDSAGNTARADELRADAGRLLPAVLALYEPGRGVWDSLHRDGTRVEMRHVFDYATIGLTLRDDLTPATRTEMTGFVERELLTDHWMRAQSLSDPAAAKSDRPDHGPMGAFSAWPAETLAVMCEFGQYDLALDFLHRCATVTAEGPFSQSRELLGKTPDAPVHIASRGEQTYYVSSGASFAETVIRGFFSFQPDFLAKSILSDTQARGFQGDLLNVRLDGRLVDIHRTSNGVIALEK